MVACVCFRLDWATTLKMARDTARGMAFLHSAKPAILHRDLKVGGRGRGIAVGWWSLGVVECVVSTHALMYSCGWGVGVPPPLRHHLEPMPVSMISKSKSKWTLN